MKVIRDQKSGRTQADVETSEGGWGGLAAIAELDFIQFLAMVEKVHFEDGV